MPHEVTVIVEGMTCANCAAGITRRLSKAGYANVHADFATGEVQVGSASPIDLGKVGTIVREAGYTYAGTKAHGASGLAGIERKLLLTLPFTLPLLAHMVVPWQVLHRPEAQFLLCLPVMAIGLLHFGKGAVASVRNRVPNMDVLILMGSTAAFLYSTWGVLLHYGTPVASQFLFFETSATIITLVLLGNVIEHRAVRQTADALTELGRLQQGTATRLIMENGTERSESVQFSDLVRGDTVQLALGDSIPADGQLASGHVSVDESMVTGESLPRTKGIGDGLLGGTVVTFGSGRMTVTANGEATVLAGIIRLVRQARQERPSLQRLADRISAVFVPTVVAIALLTFGFSTWWLGLGLEASLMRAIAVLVISCPCAMGLATPTAVSVGLGKAAHAGMLFRSAQAMEHLSKVKTVVFDKTGTLTTGKMTMAAAAFFGVHESDAYPVLLALESQSNHPVAQSVVSALTEAGHSQPSELSMITEIRGVGMEGHDSDGNHWQVGSWRLMPNALRKDGNDLFLLKNEHLVASFRLADQIRPGALELIRALREAGIRTVLLSGDREAPCRRVFDALGMDGMHAEQLPEDKYRRISEWAASSPVAMVGDGINDAPALTKATVGISFSDATQVAMNAAHVVILGTDSLSKVNEAITMGKRTSRVIRQNLFWAFAYNAIAIPIAAAGMLNPMVAAFSMAFSDVVVIGNAIRFKLSR